MAKDDYSDNGGSLKCNQLRYQIYGWKVKVLYVELLFSLSKTIMVNSDLVALWIWKATKKSGKFLEVDFPIPINVRFIQH